MEFYEIFLYTGVVVSFLIALIACRDKGNE